MEVFLGPDDYSLVVIPPGVWNGFKGMSEPYAIVANCCTHAHDPSRSERLDPFDEPHPVRLGRQAPLSDAGSRDRRGGLRRVARRARARRAQGTRSTRSSAANPGRGSRASRTSASSAATSPIRPPSTTLVARVRARALRPLRLDRHARRLPAPRPRTRRTSDRRVTSRSALVEHGCARLVGVGTCFEYASSDEPLRESSPLGPTTPYAQREAGGTRADARARARAHERRWPGRASSTSTGPARTRAGSSRRSCSSLLAGQPARTTPGEQLPRLPARRRCRRGARRGRAERRRRRGERRLRPRGRRARDRRDARADHRPTPTSSSSGALPYAPGDPMVVGADNRRLTEECGFTPRRTLAEGLAETVRWWSEHRGAHERRTRQRGHPDLQPGRAPRARGAVGARAGREPSSRSSSPTTPPTDGTADLCDELAAADPRVRVVRHDEQHRRRGELPRGARGRARPALHVAGRRRLDRPRLRRRLRRRPRTSTPTMSSSAGAARYYRGGEQAFVERPVNLLVRLGARPPRRLLPNRHAERPLLRRDPARAAPGAADAEGRRVRLAPGRGARVRGKDPHARRRRDPPLGRGGIAGSRTRSAAPTGSRSGRRRHWYWVVAQSAFRDIRESPVYGDLGRARRDVLAAIVASLVVIRFGPKAIAARQLARFGLLERARRPLERRRR